MARDQSFSSKIKKFKNRNKTLRGRNNGIRKFNVSTIGVPEEVNRKNVAETVYKHNDFRIFQELEESINSHTLIAFFIHKYQ